MLIKYKDTFLAFNIPVWLNILDLGQIWWTCRCLLSARQLHGWRKNVLEETPWWMFKASAWWCSSHLPMRWSNHSNETRLITNSCHFENAGFSLQQRMWESRTVGPDTGSRVTLWWNTSNMKICDASSGGTVTEAQLRGFTIAAVNAAFLLIKILLFNQEKKEKHLFKLSPWAVKCPVGMLLQNWFSTRVSPPLGVEFWNTKNVFGPMSA